MIKDALREQEQKYREQLEAKERQIRQQKEIMGRQQQMLMKSTQMTAPPQDVIDIRDVQRLQELDIQDRYNVLEFLVKELIGLKRHHHQHDESLPKSDSTTNKHSKQHKKGHVKVEDVDTKNKGDIEEISVDSDGQSVKKSARGR